jgi:Protein of unknown function (DUF1552)
VKGGTAVPAHVAQGSLRELLEIFRVAGKQLERIADDGRVAEIGDGIDVIAQLVSKLDGFQPLGFRRSVQRPGSLARPGAQAGCRHQRGDLLNGGYERVGTVCDQYAHEIDIAVLRREVKRRRADKADEIPPGGDIRRTLRFSVVPIERDLTEYLEAVREIEQRIQNTERSGVEAGIALPSRPDDVPESFEDYVKLMFDLQVVAFQADVTRVITLLMGRETSPRTFEQIGVPEQHHSCSHHIDNPDLIARKAKIDQYHIALFGYFLRKLQATPDGDGNLLDHSMILYGGGLGNGNLHNHVNLPVLVAGGGAGTLSVGCHLNYPENTPMANVLLALLDKAGVPTPEKIGDSTEHLTGL